MLASACNQGCPVNSKVTRSQGNPVSSPTHVLFSGLSFRDDQDQCSGEEEGEGGGEREREREKGGESERKREREIFTSPLNPYVAIEVKSSNFRNFEVVNLSQTMPRSPCCRWCGVDGRSVCSQHV